jgi:hypothetical protein
VAAAIASQFLASACGGGGSATAVTGGASPPPPGPSSPPSNGGVRPELQIEHDPDGAAFLRVTEQSYSPFGANGPDRTIRDLHLGPAPGSNYVIEGNQSTLVSNVDVEEMKHGLTLQQSGLVSIYDYTYSRFAGAGSIFGAAIKLGDNDRPTDGSTYIQRVVADGMQTPDATYKISNNDFLGVEEDSGPIFVRDVTARNFGDAGVDTKSNQVYIMNATLENTHRMVRAWPNVEIILVNSIINAAPGHAQGWVYDATSTIRYYNTLWCQTVEAPSAASANCRTTPWAVESETQTMTVAAARFIPLSENPLPGISPFFKTEIDQIVAEYSRDGGNTWAPLALPNMGGQGSAPVGDTRYRIPLNLADATYQFRASYRLNGAKVGETSAVIGEDGKTAG